MIITQVINIDIIDEILIRPEALNSYLGQEVNGFLADQLDKIKVPTLINIDLRKANPIDYSFTKDAFGTFYQRVTFDETIDSVFYLNNSQVKSLYWGLLEFEMRKLNGVGDYENEFKISNSIKISTEKKDLQFVSNFKEIELKILNFINSCNTITDKDLYLYFTSEGISYDDIIDSIRSLRAKKFIYTDEIAPQKQFISIAYKRDNI